MLQQLLRNRLGPSVKISDISFVLPRERLPRKTQQMLDGWCESFAGVGVKNIDTLGYEPPKSSERSGPQEMAELMGLDERFGGAAPRHTVSIFYRTALAWRTARPQLLGFHLPPTITMPSWRHDRGVPCTPDQGIEGASSIPCYLPACRFCFPC